MTIISGCKESDTEPPKPPKPPESVEPTLNVVQKELSFSDNASENYIDVTSNVEWTLSGATEWCSVDISSGTGTQKVKVSVSANESYDGRSAQLVFTAKDISKVVTINQNPKGTLFISNKIQFAANQGEVVAIEVKHNISGYDIIIPNKEKWISMVETKALVTDVVNFRVETNPTNENRSVLIVVKDEQSSLSDTVALWQVADNSLVLTQKTYNIDNQNHTIGVVVKENVDIDVPANTSWISMSQVMGIGTRKLIFKVDKSEYDNRSATIVIKDKSSSERDAITINQSQTNAILLTKKTYTAPSSGGNIEIELKSNVSYSVSIPIEAGWIQQVMTRGLQTSVLKFSVYPLPSGVEQRKTPIYIQDKATNTADTLIIRQMTGAFTVNVKTPGTLKDLLTYDEKIATVSIFVTGDLNADDFKAMRDGMPLLRDVDISGANITSIAAGAFEGKVSINSIIIPTNIKSIGYRAFYGCSLLTSINIPAGVTEIGSSAFLGCSELQEVICNPTTPPVLYGWTFRDTPETKILKVPSGSVDAYKANASWSPEFNNGNNIQSL